MSARESSLPPTNRKDVPVTTPGGHRIQLRVFPAAQSSSVVIVAGAMGVGQQCYEKFARFLICLLYSYDAADDGLGVDLGGRRLII